VISADVSDAVGSRPVRCIGVAVPVAARHQHGKSHPRSMGYVL